MLIRWATPEDIPAWLALSREYDECISELTGDMALWYDGFDVYMDRKIAQREALIAAGRETCLGLTAFSRMYNRITFFGLSHAADERAAEALMAAALRELDPSRAVTVNTPKGSSPKLQNEKRFLESQGFALYDDTVMENGAPMYGMIKQPKEDLLCQ